MKSFLTAILEEPGMLALCLLCSFNATCYVFQSKWPMALANLLVVSGLAALIWYSHWRRKQPLEKEKANDDSGMV